MNWVRYGPNAWLLRFADAVGEDAFYRSRLLRAELEKHPPQGLLEYVPAFTSVLLEFAPGQPQVEEEVLPSFIARFNFGTVAKISAAATRQIPVLYDGPDLVRVAAHNELSIREVIEIHSAPTYTVYMLGFSPGFPYLGELDPCLHTPRLSAPRVKVPAGAVAIGGPHTGIYTIDSPGGWNIIGRTPIRIFSPQSDSPERDPADCFLLQAGDRVRFVPQT